MPDVSHLKTYGSTVSDHIPKEKRAKLDKTSEKEKLVGCTGKAYRILMGRERVTAIGDMIKDEHVYKQKTGGEEAAKGIGTKEPSKERKAMRPKRTKEL
jgi:hypothetical protein